MNTKASEAEKRARQAHKSRLLGQALVMAWTDFLDDLRDSRAGDDMSIAMEARVEWIQELSDAIGPISWREVPVPLLETGWFQRVHEQLGFPVDHEEIAVEVARHKERRRRITEEADRG